MKNMPMFKSIRARQLFWLFVVALIPLSLFSVIFIQQRSAVIKQDGIERLVSVRDLKVQHLNHWLDERQADSYTLSRVLSDLASENKNLSQQKEKIRYALNNYHDSYQAYNEVFIIGVSGEVLVSTEHAHEGDNEVNEKHFINALLRDKMYIDDISVSHVSSIPIMSFSAPIYSDAQRKKIAAVLVMQLDLKQSLYSFLNESAGLGSSGEMVIVNHSLLALNQFRLTPDAALKLTINALPARHAANGRTGVIASLDYREVPVIAAYTYIPRTKWGFVVKQDESEIYASINDLLINGLILFLIVFAILIVLAVYFSRRLSQPILDMANVATRIQKGESGIRNIIDRDDEIGFLAKSFNEMAGSLEDENKFLKSYMENIIDSMPSALVCVDENMRVVMVNHEAIRISSSNGKEKKVMMFSELVPELEKYEENIAASVKSGLPELIRHVELKGSARERFFNIVIYPLLGEGMSGAVIRIDDVSNEIEKDELIRHTQKMDALGKLTGGIAHDFNNMLGVILGYGELLENMLVGEKEKAFISHINQAADRAKNLTAKLLSFSRKDSLRDREILNINDMLSEDRDLLQKTLMASIKLKMELDESLWLINVDKGRLEDAVINLCINASHAMPDGGVITLHAHNVTLYDVSAQHMPVTPGEYVVLSVSDTGTGMPRDVQEKMFDPFFTTKGTAGTGLGLSQVYGFVQQCGGGVHVYSEEGHGTRVVIYLPRYRSESDIADQENENLIPAEQRGGNENILVVDDEPSLLELTKEILESAGYKVRTATNGNDALDVLSEFEEEIDLMISDVIMPGMGGYQLAKVVMDKYPEIKIQIISGFTDKRNEESFDNELHEQSISKPYNAPYLLDKVRALLDK